MLVEQSFEAFYDEWLVRQQNMLEQLLSVSAMPDSPTKIDHQKMLIEQVLSHYQEYLEEKSKVANVDVFLLFSPTWLSAYERALLWIGDYKPSLILRLADGGVEGLTTEQKQMIEQLTNETKRAEREVSEAMAGVQESVAKPRVVGCSAIEGLKKPLMGVSEKADNLRASTMRKVVGILSPSQTVQFLSAATHFQLRVKEVQYAADGPVAFEIE
ncbi:protein RESPONSE TO ABA AND SALT 1-like [Gastrolobium bilobum]|uniref:protein RESPONSE TO ABA AND SALT 1-like n=1 Tax=Gastrolobium bilobum TaxID=150636 RepID=UPI002AB14488|nr:protein RESPONSE TO ABA AND SALT 1-like [Gastrolobium bilobum]